MPTGEMATLMWVLIGAGAALYVTFCVRRFIVDKAETVGRAQQLEVLDVMSISQSNAIYLIKIGNENIALSVSPTGARVISVIRENDLFHTKQEIQSETAQKLAESFCIPQRESFDDLDKVERRIKMQASSVAGNEILRMIEATKSGEETYISSASDGEKTEDFGEITFDVKMQEESAEICERTQGIDIIMERELERGTIEPADMAAHNLKESLRSVKPQPEEKDILMDRLTTRTNDGFRGSVRSGDKPSVGFTRVNNVVVASAPKGSSLEKIGLGGYYSGPFSEKTVSSCTVGAISLNDESKISTELCEQKAAVAVLEVPEADMAVDEVAVSEFITNSANVLKENASERIFGEGIDISASDKPQGDETEPLGSVVNEPEASKDIVDITAQFNERNRAQYRIAESMLKTEGSKMKENVISVAIDEQGRVSGTEIAKKIQEELIRNSKMTCTIVENRERCIEKEPDPVESILQDKNFATVFSSASNDIVENVSVASTKAEIGTSVEERETREIEDQSLIAKKRKNTLETKLEKAISNSVYQHEEDDEDAEIDALLARLEKRRRFNS